MFEQDHSDCLAPGMPKLKELGLSVLILKRILAGEEETVQLIPESPLPEIPSYGILLDLLEFSKYIAASEKCKSNIILKRLVDNLFPVCSISRADRLQRKVESFAQPLLAISTAKEKEQYLHQLWKPQATGISKVPEVTEEMKKYHLDNDTFHGLLNNSRKNKWNLTASPSIKFYTDLHTILKRKRIPMEEMGYIYRSIDDKLNQSTKNNKEAYQKISGIVSGKHNSSLVIYCPSSESESMKTNSRVNEFTKEEEQHYFKQNVKRREKRARGRISQLRNSLKHFRKMNKKQQKEIESLSNQVQQHQGILCERNSEIKSLKMDVRWLEQALDVLDCEVHDIRQEEEIMQAKHAATIQELTDELQELRDSNEISTFSSRTYNTNIRELYYSLLSLKVPPAKIKTILYNVIAHLIPSVNTSEIRLPGKSCAAYMRSHEMPSLSEQQKGNHLIKTKEWHLSTDGTTLKQQKKVVMIINGLVFGVKDVPNGSAQATLDALKSELRRLEDAMIMSPKPNFTLDHIVSCTGDGASSQVKFNRLISESGKKIIENKCSMHLGVNLRYAQVKAMNIKEIVAGSQAQATKINAECYSSDDDMDVKETENESNEEENEETSNENSEKTSSEEESEDTSNEQESEETINEEERKVEIAEESNEVMNEDEDDDSVVQNVKIKKRRYKDKDMDIDCFVYELCKLFGHLGTPEYCHGASFRVFISKESNQCNGDLQHYYNLVQSVRLKRNVGSRYYVTSHNAAHIFFLRKAMLAFLQEQKFIKKLNYLESTCLRKLNDTLLITKLRLEGLIYDKVYSDLMTLVKSKVLDKSSYSMNIHYQELLQFLEKLISVPRLILDSEVYVFLSEPRLYSTDSKANCRLHNQYMEVRKELYEQNYNTTCSNESLLLKMTSLVGQAMSTKLQSYKCDHLPGGKYFKPDLKTQTILSTLQPHNDMAESVFGANDWLSSALPNMAQATRSVLIEFTYNKTMEWLRGQSEEQKQVIISLAQARRKEVERKKKYDSKVLLEQKIQDRIQAIEKSKVIQERTVAAIQQLESEELIMSPEQLQSREKCIRTLSLCKILQDTELKMLVKKQIKLRQLVYHQSVNIFLSSNGKPKSVDQLLIELMEVITSNPAVLHVRRKTPISQKLYAIFDKPSLLTGAKFKHRFEVDGNLQWFEGCIQKYVKKHYTLYYYDTNEICIFSVEEITYDFVNGDFWII